MEEFKYKQTLIGRTEFVELLCLKIYCFLNKYDYLPILKRRTKEMLNKFPDFVVGTKCLEITRAMDDIDGKQQKDIHQVFDSKDKEKAIRQINQNLQKYKEKGFDHKIHFEKFENVEVAIKPISNYQDICSKAIKKVIDSINNKYNAFIKHKDESIDLIIDSFDILNSKQINIINDYIQANINLKGLVYLFFLNQEDATHINVAIFGSKFYKIDSVKQYFSYNLIAEEIFALGWLKKKDFEYEANKD